MKSSTQNIQYQSTHSHLSGGENHIQNHGKNCKCNLVGGETRVSTGGVYSYICVLPDSFVLKTTLCQRKLVRQNLNI